MALLRLEPLAWILPNWVDCIESMVLHSIIITIVSDGTRPDRTEFWLAIHSIRINPDGWSGPSSPSGSDRSEATLCIDGRLSVDIVISNYHEVINSINW